MEACYVFFSVVFFMSKDKVVSDSASTLFTPETLAAFSGLKHFTYPSIGIGVSSE